MNSDIYREVGAIVEQTPFIDTHEHLYEESFRLERHRTHVAGMLAPDDISLLFFNYANADLISAGMSRSNVERFWQTEVEPEEKWRLIAPFYPYIRTTGYGQAIRETLRILYNIDDLNEQTCRLVSESIREGVRPGFYRRIMVEISNVAYAHVNAIDPDGTLPFYRESEQPELLKQDLSTVRLSTNLDLPAIEQWYGKTLTSLEELHAAIDAIFAAYAPRAIATKNQCAYHRRLNFDLVPAEDAAPLFDRYRKDPMLLTPEEHKALQDHLFHYCVQVATEYDLMVKLHTGYFAGTGAMPLEHVRKNASDLCGLLRQYPNTRFDIFHINFPYQDEAIALAKHYPNAYVDMCWAWIVNPEASVRFLKEFLRAAPMNKLFTFGGDYRMIELLPGHARIARDGITRALTEMIEEGSLEMRDVQFVAERIMKANAVEVFEKHSERKRSAAPGT